MVAHLLALRGIGDPQHARAVLDPTLYHPTPPAALPDIEIAVETIRHALSAGQHLGVWGDFDVDGQTSTALLVQGFRSLGANVS